METLVSGTVESLLIVVTDRRETLTDLSTLSPTFYVVDKDDVEVQAATPVDADGMDAYCVVDTAAGGGWDSGIYRIFITFSASPEIPVKGPFPFRVEEV